MSKGLGKLQRQLLTTLATDGMTVGRFEKLPKGLAHVRFVTWALSMQLGKQSRAGIVATGRALRGLGEKGYVEGWSIPRLDSQGKAVAGSRWSAWALTPAGEAEAKSKGTGVKVAFAESLLAAAAAYKA